jgi:hypothetical protein
MKAEPNLLVDRFGQIIVGWSSRHYRLSLADVRRLIVQQAFLTRPLANMTRVLGILLLAGGLSTFQLAAGADVPILSIVQPSHGETIHDNLGEVNVTVALQGTNLSQSRYLRVLLDGEPYGAKLRTLSFAIEHVERGEHTLQVALLDQDNAIVVASPTITFYLWQASRLFLFPKM